MVIPPFYSLCKRIFQKREDVCQNYLCWKAFRDQLLTTERVARALKLVGIAASLVGVSCHPTGKLENKHILLTIAWATAVGACACSHPSLWYTLRYLFDVSAEAT